MKKDFHKRLERFASALEKIDVEKIFLEAVKETSDLALDLNKVQMLELGVDSTDKPLGQYKESTKRRKQKKGQPTDHITLRDTGSFQDKMFVDAKRIPILIDSRDQKTDLIEGKWPKALGLTPVFADQYKERVMVVFRRKYEKIIEDKKKILQ